MSDSYLNLVVDDITMDVFPLSKLYQNHIYKKLLCLKGCHLSSSSIDEYNAFLTPLPSSKEIEENPRSGSLPEASPRRSLPLQAISILIISLLMQSCAPIHQGQRDSLPLTPAPLVSTIRPAGSVSVEITQPEATAETRLVSEPKEKRFIPPKDIAAGVRMDLDRK